MENIKTDKTHVSYKLSELFVSLLLVVTVAVSFSISHHYNSGVNVESMNLNELPRMRGGPVRQVIKMGSPESWLKAFNQKLKSHNIDVAVSQLETVWFIDASIDSSVPYSIQNELKVFLSRYGVDTNNIHALHITLMGI